MPVLFNQNIHNKILALWLIEESLDQLILQAGPYLDQEPAFQQITSSARQKEWLAVRLLAQNILGIWPKIAYSPSGRPFIIGSKQQISITHTRNMAGILLGDENRLGIDVEQNNRNIEKVLPRFLSPTEYEKFHEADHQTKITCWCAKEAVFKAMGEDHVTFSSQIELLDITQTSPYGQIRALFRTDRYQTSIELNTFQISGHIVVWTR